MKQLKTTITALFFLGLLASCQSGSVSRDLASYCNHDDAVSREVYWADYELCENH